MNPPWHERNSLLKGKGDDDAFKSYRIHRFYELNAHERYQKVVFKSGKLKIVFKPSFWVGGVSVKKNVSDAMDTAKDCS